MRKFSLHRTRENNSSGKGAPGITFLFEVILVTHVKTTKGRKKEKASHADAHNAFRPIMSRNLSRGKG